ncbi:hypothetical protein ECH_0100 [Ehrlichia chaffeensis str. Arkansas]|uniref:Uncharacterized protein n=1 Tax=Ehrlichia chaffeensis (strain ATCC CRL-10679 / Arkansas) TaxID=205920 RepID=Q2GI05_EHRCR|nr:hypothetical protein ECH_0100 [Ehrlichia chaffeensis str. Arkansas]
MPLIKNSVVGGLIYLIFFQYYGVKRMKQQEFL